MVTRTRIRLEPLRVDGHEVGRVLITGASGGIGAELARVFAQHGHRLTLVARRKKKLAALARELEREHHVDVQLVVQDLARRAGRLRWRRRSQPRASRWGSSSTTPVSSRSGRSWEAPRPTSSAS